MKSMTSILLPDYSEPKRDSEGLESHMTEWILLLCLRELQAKGPALLHPQ